MDGTNGYRNRIIAAYAVRKAYEAPEFRKFQEEDPDRADCAIFRKYELAGIVCDFLDDSDCLDDEGCPCDLRDYVVSYLEERVPELPMVDYSTRQRFIDDIMATWTIPIREVVYVLDIIRENMPESIEAILRE